MEKIPKVMGTVFRVASIVALLLTIYGVIASPTAAQAYDDSGPTAITKVAGEPTITGSAIEAIPKAAAFLTITNITIDTGNASTELLTYSRGVALVLALTTASPEGKPTPVGAPGAIEVNATLLLGANFTGAQPTALELSGAIGGAPFTDDGYGGVSDLTYGASTGVRSETSALAPDPGTYYWVSHQSSVSFGDDDGALTACGSDQTGH